jgi:hypothetical protein
MIRRLYYPHGVARGLIAQSGIRPTCLKLRRTPHLHTGPPIPHSLPVTRYPLRLRGSTQFAQFLFAQAELHKGQNVSELRGRASACDRRNHGRLRQQPGQSHGRHRCVVGSGDFVKRSQHFKAAFTRRGAA